MPVLKIWDGTQEVEIGAGNVGALANIADHAIVRGAGGGTEIQDSTASIADNGVMSVPGLSTGGVTNYDLKVGNPADYGMVKIGNARIGRTSFNAGNIDLDGAILISNLGGPVTGNIEIIFTESTGDTCRLAIPKSGAGLHTYHPRSIVFAGPAPADTAFVEIAYWQTQGLFHNLPCDTVSSGADLGVQGSAEIERILYVDNIQESTPGAGITFGNEIKGAILGDNLDCNNFDINDLINLRFDSGGAILDANSNELVKITATGSAINEFTIANAATGSGPTLSATGDGTDANIDINIVPLGTGQVKPGEVFMATTTKIIFGAPTVYIRNDGGNHLELVSDDLVEVIAQELDVTAAVDIHGPLAVDTDVLYVDATSDRVGMGTTSPDKQLHVVLSGTPSAPRGLRVDYHANATTASSIEFGRSRGTAGSPTALQSADQVGLLGSWGYDGAAYQRSGYAGFIVDGAVSGGVVPQAFRVGTGTASFGTERWRTDSAGCTVHGATSADGSAILELVSTAKGFLPPAMTTAQRNAIGAPATGLVIFNITTGVLDFYNGAAWGAV